MNSATIAEPAITWDEAEAALRRSEARFEAGDWQGLISRYADDVVLRFADLPEIRGRDAAARFFQARFARQRNYRLSKKLFLVAGQKMANSWTGTWEDARTGKQMRGHGVELIELHAGKVILWECSFNVWEEGNEAASRYFEIG
jgi:nuclear transport factor 2 (NTF2) superfamily protein